MPCFKRDDGSVVEVDFDYALSNQFGSFLELPDGTLARRVYEPEPPKVKEGAASSVEKPIVSDALGFTAHQLQEMEQHRVEQGFSGVEFKRDPHEPTFYQVHIANKAEWARYMKSRGFSDHNSTLGSGAQLSPELLQRAVDKVMEQYGEGAIEL
jgi:hypothetical protein